MKLVSQSIWIIDNSKLQTFLSPKTKVIWTSVVVLIACAPLLGDCPPWTLIYVWKLFPRKLWFVMSQTWAFIVLKWDPHLESFSEAVGAEDVDRAEPMSHLHQQKNMFTVNIYHHWIHTAIFRGTRCGITCFDSFNRKKWAANTAAA